MCVCISGGVGVVGGGGGEVEGGSSRRGVGGGGGSSGRRGGRGGGGCRGQSKTGPSFWSSIPTLILLSRKNEKIKK